jgi:rhodanese-related sulfurtransferase
VRNQRQYNAVNPILEWANMNLLSYFFNTKPIKQIDAAALNKEKAKYFLIDVRRPEEYRQGHISGAKLIPLHQLASRMQELPPRREIVCVCHSGNRSKSAARKLSAAGFEAVNLRGGMIAWMRASLPVKKGGK